MAWEALLDAVQRVPDELRTLAGVVPGWSVVDLVFHCGKCAELAGTHLEEMATGTFDDEPLPDEAVQAQNDEWAAESATLSWEQAIAIAEAGRAKARAALERLSDPGELAASWFSDETFEHYPEHTHEIARFAGDRPPPPDREPSYPADST